MTRQRTNTLICIWAQNRVKIKTRQGYVRACLPAFAPHQGHPNMIRTGSISWFCLHPTTPDKSISYVIIASYTTILNTSRCTYLYRKGPLGFLTRGAARSGELKDSVMLLLPGEFLIEALPSLGGSRVARTSTWVVSGFPCAGTGPVPVYGIARSALTSLGHLRGCLGNLRERGGSRP